MIVLLVDILEEPATTQSTMLLQTIRSFTTFLETFQREEKCDLAKLIAACGTLLWVAQAAVQRARDGTDVVVPEGTAGVTPEVSTFRQR
jgi:predicted fused transcriptional regulator/phosphomethylpyrimidine kinase